jgi:hypothetical protein
MNTEQTKQFLQDSEYALNSLFSALEGYNEVLSLARIEVKKIEDTKGWLSDNFMHEGQWDDNANFHHSQYVKRVEELNARAGDIPTQTEITLKREMEAIGATMDSMRSIAGAILQTSKQILSIRYAGKPDLPNARCIGTQNIVEVIWEGRNHALHWEEGETNAKPKVKAMLNALAADLGSVVSWQVNNSLEILQALGWSTAVIFNRDMSELV